MKVLLVDLSIEGHHIPYINGLVSIPNVEFVAVLPETTDKANCRQRVFKNKEGKKRSYFAFRRWLNEIHKICREEKPDVVHFLYGDSFYRYFGFGLDKFKKYKLIMTLHWARSGFLQRISTRMICRRVKSAVVHSAYIKELLESYGVKNAIHVEYPQFNQHFVDKADACDFWGLDKEIPVIGCIGGTRHDKGLDILLEALKDVDKPFQLLVAGKEESFGESFIREQSKEFRGSVHVCLKFLSDEELANAIAASDIIALPYRKVFDGASGPLGEGVSMGKCILGPNHGTLGYTISKYNLGYVFETENTSNLTSSLTKVLSNEFKKDDKYISYQQSLNPEFFADKYKKTYSWSNGYE